MKILSKISDKLKDTKTQNLCLLLEIIVSLMVFATLSGGAGVDYDEAYSWDLVVNNGLSGILSATAADVHPPLYYLIVKAIFAVFGASIKVMVWTSILPVILGMVLFGNYIRKKWGIMPALLFNIVYGFAPFILHYNLNLRMYSWMDLFVMGTVFTSYEIACDKECGKKVFVMLFVYSILGVYTQYFALLPIVVCYLWLFVTLAIRKNFRRVVWFLIVGAMDVISYIPWLLYGMKNMGIGSTVSTEEYRFYLHPSEIFELLFGTNLENGDAMAMLLVVISLLMFTIMFKRFSQDEKSFLFMLLINVIFCWFFSQKLGSMNGHFFNPRYIIYCLVMLWLFMVIVYSKVNGFVFVVLSLWTIELSLSSYLIERAYEYDSTPLMEKTVAFIETNVASDAVMVYDFNREFGIIWQYYMPGHEMVYYEDLELESMKGQTFWVINMGGANISEEDKEKYSIEIEHNPGMGYMGIERFDLWKVEVGN